MFVSGFNIEVSFQSTVEEHYFDIKERDFVVREGTGKLDGRMQVFSRSYCSYGNLLCHKINSNLFPNDWAVC